MKPVVIVGGGLSGLACAITLHRRGLPVQILEQEKVLGGRVATETREPGFRLDAGFQVLLDSYPELRGFIDLDRLQLQRFRSGACVFDGSRLRSIANPLKHPLSALRGLSSVDVRDVARVLALLLKSRAYKHDGIREGRSTAQFLVDFGFSQKFIDFFWQPFMTGIYLDETLSLDSGYFLFLVRCFGLGSVSVPALGMAEIPRQMVGSLPESAVRTSVSVASMTSSSVSLVDGETLDASAVVRAFAPVRLDARAYRSATTHYFSLEAKVKLDWERWLILVPSYLGLKLNHVALMSEVARDYAPRDHQFVAATVVGPKTASHQDVVEELQRLSGRPLALIHLKSCEIVRALPPLAEAGPGFEIDDGVFICGDAVSSPSINGALRSGRLAAEAIVSKLGG